MSDPTPSQALLLFGLLARHGECAQAELIPTVKKADREALEKARLIGVGKAGRGLKLTLDDAGWAWAADHLAAELPPPQRALADLLARLGEHLAKSGETLAEFIGSKPEGAVEGKGIAPTKANAASKRKAANPKALTPVALRKRIETAYLVISGNRKNSIVKLALLRHELCDLDRATLDAGLGRILAGDKKASLMRHDDPKQISLADRDAAYAPFGEPFHVLWIAS